MDFKIGDRVRCIKIDNFNLQLKKTIIGKEGTVLIINQNNPRIGVCFDDDIGGHDLCLDDNNDKCKFGHGWYVFEDCIEKIEDTIKPKYTSVIDWIN